jgi:hypothetical protein
VAYLALFVALGGTSYAVATGSVDSRAIKNESVRSGDLRDNEVRSRDIRNRTIVARDLLSNTLGGDHILEKELGEVPLATRAKSADDALSLGGVPASGYARAGAASPGERPVANTVDVVDAGAGTVLQVPGFGTLRVAAAGCSAATDVVTFEWVSTALVTQDVWSTAPSYNPVPAAGTSSEFALGSNGRVRIAPQGSPAKQATIDVFLAGVDGDTECRVSALAVTSG